MTKPGIDTPPGAQVASAASPGYGEQTADPGGYPFESLDAPSDDPRLWSKVPLELLVRYSCVPVRMNGSRLLLAFSNLDDPGQIDDLEYQLGQPIDAAIAPGQRVSEVLKLHRGGEMLLRQATDSLRLELVDEDAGDTVDLDKTSTENPIVRLVDSVILGALDRRASDIHVETKDQEVLVKYRIDGALFPAIDPLDKKHHETIISRIKVMSELDIAEKRIPQDGRFRLRAKGRTVDFRVSIMPSVYGEDAVIRILDKESLNAASRDLNLDVLGFAEAELTKLRKYITEPYGMLVVTGRRGAARRPRSTRRCPRSRVPRTRSSPSRTPSSTRSRASRRYPSTRGRGSPSPVASAPSCATTPTRSWSARYATPRPRRSRCSPL